MHLYIFTVLVLIQLEIKLRFKSVTVGEWDVDTLSSFVFAVSQGKFYERNKIWFKHFTKKRRDLKQRHASNEGTPYLSQDSCWRILSLYLSVTVQLRKYSIPIFVMVQLEQILFLFVAEHFETDSVPICHVTGLFYTICHQSLYHRQINIIYSKLYYNYNINTQ